MKRGFSAIHIQRQTMTQIRLQPETAIQQRRQHAGQQRSQLTQPIQPWSAPARELESQHGKVHERQSEQSQRQNRQNQHKDLYRGQQRTDSNAEGTQENDLVHCHSMALSA